MVIISFRLDDCLYYRSLTCIRSGNRWSNMGCLYLHEKVRQGKITFENAYTKCYLARWIKRLTKDTAYLVTK